MEVDKHVLFLASLLCLVVLVGCSKEGSISKDMQDSKNERTPSKLEAVQMELTNLANRVYVGNVPSYNYVESLRKNFPRCHAQNVKRLLHALKMCFPTLA